MHACTHACPCSCSCSYYYTLQAARGGRTCSDTTLFTRKLSRCLEMTKFCCPAMAVVLDSNAQLGVGGTETCAGWGGVARARARVQLGMHTGLGLRAEGRWALP